MLANWSHTDNEQCNKSHSGAPIWFPNPVTAAWYYCSSFFFSPHFSVFFFAFLSCLFHFFFFSLHFWYRKLHRSCKLKQCISLFIMCLFRYRRNEKLYQFLSLSFDLFVCFSFVSHSLITELFRFVKRKFTIFFSSKEMQRGKKHTHKHTYTYIYFTPESSFMLICTTDWYHYGITFFALFPNKAK